MNFGEIIKQERKSQGMTQKELAAKAKIATTTLSFLESGVGRYPNVETLTSVAYALGIYPSWLILNSISEKDVPAENRERFQELRKEMAQLLKVK